MNFEDNELKAICQCLWQICKSNPYTKKALLDYCDSLNVFSGKDFLWFCESKSMNPFDAFNTISKMSTVKKCEFKSIVFDVVNYDEDPDCYKARLAITLFDKTSVPYTYTAKSIWGGNDRINIKNASVI